MSEYYIIPISYNQIMTKPSFSLARKDDEMRELIEKTDQKILARWAIDCAERVMHFFENMYPNDPRPQNAILELKAWILTGVFKMSVIRKASLDAHAAAKEIGNPSTSSGQAPSPAASVAHAAGQAVATAHVKTHAYGPAIYAQQAIFRATGDMEKVEEERDWQYKHLLELRKKDNTDGANAG